MDPIAAKVENLDRNVSETEAVNLVPRFVDAINHLVAVAYPSLELALLDAQLILDGILLILVDLICQKVVVLHLKVLLRSKLGILR
mmetsp:Transcript_8838/g.12655  ORF Transcript_8838/g.12655 Transcript_8838/m.12655 type:complete len:86 (-) Transcript_8838:957-1214(-)